MPLLDGRYEILAERSLGPGVVRFDATTADGEPIRVVWYDIASAEEAAFERYRRALRRLARDGMADVADVVSRPGARYVAWRSVDADVGAALESTEPLRVRLSELGLAAEHARVRSGPAGAVVVDLPFGADVAPPSEQVAAAPRAPLTARPRPALVLSDTALSWLLSGALALVALVLTFAGAALRTTDALVVVPEPGSGDVAEVAERLIALGLRVDGVPRASSDSVGVVLGIDPGPGTPLRPGRSVRVVYAAPPGRLAPTSVPTLLGLELDTARQRLTEAGLELDRVVRLHEESPSGVVLAQSVAAGDTVGVGSGVDVVVSLGPRPRMTFVPDLVGLTAADASAVAAVAGLVAEAVIVETVATRDATPGTVVSQSLPAYRRVPIDDAVLRLLVAQGSPSVPDVAHSVPDVTGLSEAQARALLAPSPIEVRYLYDAALPDGVVWQQPPPGAEEVGSTLTLGVNQRPLVIPRPTIDAQVRRPQLREIPYLWFVEPGIPTQTAVVTATTLDGERSVVRSVAVRGGERVEGTWWTTYPGPVRLRLTLNDEPYGDELLVP